jgi:ring-1,2-phenylacetyl-CoA epoxidase subunit PaaD
VDSEVIHTTSDIWALLHEIPDPELVIISLVDLGIIRELAWDEEILVVAVTPTYSGCPATMVIRVEIEGALKAHGIKKVRFETRLSPPWTTDWISESGRTKLKEAGIVPPGLRGKNAAGEDGTLAGCPRCDSSVTERISQFGSTPCKATWRCRECLEPFEYFKCI